MRFWSGVWQWFEYRIGLHNLEAIVGLLEQQSGSVDLGVHRCVRILLIALIKFSWANLRRNRKRTALTVVGVMIGVAALYALMAYGAGLQQNVKGEVDSLGLFNTLRVTSRPSSINSFGDLTVRKDSQLSDSVKVIPMSDELIEDLEARDDILVAYPEINFPIQIKANGLEIDAMAEAIPQAFRSIQAYVPEYGDFFEASTDSSILLSDSQLRRLGFENPAEVVGQKVTAVTAQIDMAAMQRMMFRMSFGMSNLPLKWEEHELKVAGVLQDDQAAMSGLIRVLVPLDFATKMKKVTFFSTIDLLMRQPSSQAEKEGYSALRVQLKPDVDFNTAVSAVENTGAFVSSFRDQFKQLERLFVLVDLALAVIGLIALIVATVGIANTMTMSVMERYGEIGIMKAIGGEESDLKKIFLSESALIGLIGGLIGLFVGWLLTLGIDALANYYFYSKGLPKVSLFHTFPMMIAGILLTTLFVSLLAGYLPARKAAKVKPLVALKRM